MKKLDRKAEIARQHRAERTKRSTSRKSKVNSLIEHHHRTIRPSPLTHALAPLRSTILAALGATSLIGCQVDEQVINDAGGDEAGVMAGSEAGSIGGIELEICENPQVIYNRENLPTGYVNCAQGMQLKVGPALCRTEGTDNSGCAVDSDCETGFQCLCYSDQASGQCVPATCTEGSECEMGACGVSNFYDGCVSQVSLACYTDRDLCRGSEECAEQTGVAACYASDDGWRCSEYDCAIGRPLLEAGNCQVAPITIGEGWVKEIPHLNCSSLSAEEKAYVLTRWKSIVQLEHSSVASFARFTLQLMSLGAPAELLHATQLAAADEVRHTQQAAEILSALSGNIVSLGDLSTDTLTLTCTREQLMSQLIHEACVGETLGVAEVTEAARLCTHPLVRTHLEHVRDDETRHAQLAWQSLHWLIESAPIHEQAALSQLALECFEKARQDLVSQPILKRSEMVTRNMNILGVLTPSQVYLTRSIAYQEVIEPCLEVLRRSAA